MSRSVNEVIDWTVDGRIDRLRELWESGKSFSEISLELVGHYRGRNAVAGKLHRLNARVAWPKKVKTK